MRTDIFCLAYAATINVAAQLNIMGTFSALGVRAFPSTNRIVVVLRLVGSQEDVGEHTIVVRVVTDGNTLLVSSPPTACYLSESHNAPGQVELPGVLVMSPAFPAPGEYTVQLLVDGLQIASSPVHVYDNTLTVTADR